MSPEQFAEIFDAVQVLQLRPGDVLVFRVRGPLMNEQAEQIERRLRELFGEDRRIVVTDDSCEFEIVRIGSVKQHNFPPTM